MIKTKMKALKLWKHWNNVIKQREIQFTRERTGMLLQLNLWKWDLHEMALILVVYWKHQFDQIYKE